MIRKAVIIESIFFGAAGFLVLASIFLIGFTAYEGLRVFQYTTPLAFFTGTTWNPNLLAAEETTAAVATATEAAPTAAAPVEGGQLLQGDQFIEPSAPEEGTADEAGAPAAEGQLLQGDQFIEPSAPEEGTEDAVAVPAAEGQLLQGDQFIEPSAGEDAGDETAGGGEATNPGETAAAASTAPIVAERRATNAFGVLPLLAGSLYTALLTLLISAPLAILVATFLVEIAPPRMRRITRSTVEVFAALPSVIFGLLGLVYVVPWVRVAFQTGLGKGILAATIVLIFMTQPTIILIAEDALRSLPNGLREAAWGVGATRWQVIWGTIWPAARSGLFTAVILGMGRAIGETMAVQMVIGNITEHMPLSLVEGASTMPAAIVTQLPEAASPEHRAALIMVAFVLLAVAFLLIAVVRLSLHRANPARS